MKNAFNINIENLINNGIILMNIKEQEIIEKYLDEAGAADYAKLSTSELKDLLNIFKNVGRSAAKPVLKSIKIELNKRLGEDYAIEEAKVVPFKKLEQAWTRTGGDKAKQAKLIKKHDLKRLISSVRPGEIKLGIKNKLLGTTKAATAAGLDLDDQLIFVTNNPLKIIYPKKSGRRPEGEEIKESNKVKDVSVLRLQKIVSLTINEDNEDILKSFISSANIDINTAPSKIREAYKAYKQESLEEGLDARTKEFKEKLKKLEYAKSKEEEEIEEGTSVKIKTRAGSDKYDYDELLPEVQKIVIMSKAVEKNHRMNVAKKITKAIIDGKIKNADISSDLATLIGIDQPYAGHAPTRVIKDQMKKLKLESAELEEADNRLVAHTPAAAKRLIKKLKNRFGGYSWDQRIKGDEIIYPRETHIVRFIKKQPEVADMKESTELEEKTVRRGNTTVSTNARGVKISAGSKYVVLSHKEADGLIEYIETKRAVRSAGFSIMNDKMNRGIRINASGGFVLLKPTEIAAFLEYNGFSESKIKKALSGINLKLESTDLEEAKNVTIRTLRQMLFKIDSSAADKFRRELFNVNKQDSPATSAQIKKAKKIIGNRFGKDAFVQLESTDLEEAKKVIAQVELWNGKKMKKSFKDQSSAEKFIKKMQDQEDVRGYNMYAEELES
jgi:hypothetical protein